MDKKLTLIKEKEPTSTAPVFIGTNLMNQLKEIKHETNIPVRHIVEKCIKFGLDNLEIEENE